MRRTIIFSSLLLMLAFAASSRAQHVKVFDGTTAVLLQNSTPHTTSVFAGRTVRLRIAAVNNRSKDVNDMFIFRSPVRLSHRQVSCGNSRSVSTSSSGLTAGKVSWSYSEATKEYQYDLQTDIAWKGTCRVVTLQLQDGTELSAILKLR